MASTGVWLMDSEFIAGEARRLDMLQFAHAVGEYGVIVFHESSVSVDQLIPIFEHRLRRARIRDDEDTVTLVGDLLSAFRHARSSEIKLTHVQSGKIEAMLYSEVCQILAIVLLSLDDE